MDISRTPEAQCLGQHHFQYSMEIHEPNEKFASYQHAYAAQVPFTTQQLANQQGELSSKNNYLEVDAKTFAITALKRSKFNDKVVLRGLNLSGNEEEMVVQKPGTTSRLLNLLEKDSKQRLSRH